eukprot:4306634-Prymnesium_polylepis.1
MASLPFKMGGKVERGTLFNPGLLRVSRLVMVLFIFVHLTGCLWWYIGVVHEGLPPNGWNAEEWLRHDTFWSKYSHAFFWALMQLTGLIMFDVEPITPLEVRSRAPLFRL